MTRAEAIVALQDWSGPVTTAIQDRPDPAERRKKALALWTAATPWRGTIAERYLGESRGVDVAALPASVDEALRFHRWCPFGGGACPCLLALMRDAATDEPVGIHRIALTLRPDGRIDKVERRALGGMGAIKLWPLDGTGQLVVGEGLETVLAAATRIPWRGAPLTPAWSLVSTTGVAALPVLRGVTRLIQLVDNDANQAGQNAATAARQRWREAGRTVVPLMPTTVGADFNDIVMSTRGKAA
jgi:hypothetical protein